jgi:hypothetical protein
MALANQVYPFATTFKVNQACSMIGCYLHQNLEKHNRYGNVHAVEKLRQLIQTWYTMSEYFGIMFLKNKQIL